MPHVCSRGRRRRAVPAVLLAENIEPRDLLPFQRALIYTPACTASVLRALIVLVVYIDNQRGERKPHEQNEKDTRSAPPERDSGACVKILERLLVPRSKSSGRTAKEFQSFRHTAAFALVITITLRRTGAAIAAGDRSTRKYGRVKIGRGIV